ncbi:MAG: molybdopterin-guanine dinucleotide biosynthesis protein MobB [Promethearchaeota archaeon]
MENNSNKIISFIGYSHSGKTETIESLIKYFRAKKIQVIALKHTDRPNFTIDTPGKNTWRYTQAGAQMVISHSIEETAFLLNSEISQETLLKLVKLFLKDQKSPLNEDIGLKSGSNPQIETILILEGFRKIKGSKILCIKDVSEISEQLAPDIKIITGAISTDLNEEQIIELERKNSISVYNLRDNPHLIDKILN